MRVRLSYSLTFRLFYAILQVMEREIPEFGHPIIEEQPQIEKRRRPQFGAVIALGKNWRKDENDAVIPHDYGAHLVDWNGQPLTGRYVTADLSVESKMTALKAAEMFLQGRAGRIVFATGETAGTWKDRFGHVHHYPTEAEEMKKFVRRFYTEAQIPDSAILCEDTSIDTAGNAEEVKRRFLDPLRIKNVALLTVGFHLKRSMRLFNSYGITVKQGFASDEMSDRGEGRISSAHYERYLTKYHQSDRYKALVSLEKKAELISRVDRKGKLTRLITKRSRNKVNKMPWEEPEKHTAEVLRDHYKYLVVDPYAENLIDQGSREGDVRLSFYSAFITNAAHELVAAGKVDNVVLFSDASFAGSSDVRGRPFKSTGELMKEALTKQGSLPAIPEEQIILFGESFLNSTPAQVRKLEQFLEEKGIDPNDVLYLTFPYHQTRVRSHLGGYHLSGVRTVNAVEAHKLLRPQFNAQKLDEVLPHVEIERMESRRRRLARYDRKGRIPLAVKKLRPEGFSLDNERGTDGKLHFMYKSGKKRYKEVV